mmetsp:Transcript_48135/g.75174  ORF Transcript_48135/g.75174 Transcript_48135/m.75174 type:complete len:118 (+) Transcript_48135:505-858(+)
MTESNFPSELIQCVVTSIKMQTILRIFHVAAWGLLVGLEFFFDSKDPYVCHTSTLQLLSFPIDCQVRLFCVVCRMGAQKLIGCMCMTVTLNFILGKFLLLCDDKHYFALLKKMRGNK